LTGIIYAITDWYDHHAEVHVNNELIVFDVLVYFQ